MNVLLVLLGCNIPYLLNDRVRVATQFAKEFDKTNANVTWFLSGGIKNPSEGTETEAEKMGALIAQHATTDLWDYIYDIEATNTAENFIMVKKHLLKTSITYSKVIVITSDFHHLRAKKIAEHVLGVQTSVDWVLSEAELEDSRYWEQIHIKNVDVDVKKALLKFQM